MRRRRITVRASVLVAFVAGLVLSGVVGLGSASSMAVGSLARAAVYGYDDAATSTAPPTNLLPPSAGGSSGVTATATAFVVGYLPQKTQPRWLILLRAVFI
jgi:hypothetical protein